MTDRPTDEPATPPPHDPDAGDRDVRGRSAGFRLGLLAVLVLVLLAGAGTTAWLAATRTTAADGGVLGRLGSVLSGSGGLQAEREDVMDTASQFMLRVNTYGPDLLDESGQMPEYRDLVSELITPKFKADFEQQVGTAEQTVSQAGIGRSAEVYGVGVKGMDDDSAVALVAGAFTNSYPSSADADAERVEDEPAPFRVEVSLVRIDGEWLVDDFGPVSGSGVTLEDQQPQQPAPQQQDPQQDQQRDRQQDRQRDQQGQQQGGGRQ